MPKLTPEKEKIFETYKRLLNYKKTADELDVDERTVKAVVEERRQVRDRDEQERGAAVSDSASSTGSDKTRTPATSIIKSASSEDNARNDNMIIYRELLAGKNPAQIIADHGIEADYVEKQYTSFCRQRECDVLVLQNKILTTFRGFARGIEVLPYRDLFDKRGYLTNEEIMQRGYLTNEEIMQLLRKIGKRNADLGIERIFGHNDADPPAGWVKLTCGSCNRSYAIVRQNDEIVKKSGFFSYYSRDHIDCRRPEGFS